jgi:hypothetical protein
MRLLMFAVEPWLKAVPTVALVTRDGIGSSPETESLDSNARAAERSPEQCVTSIGARRGEASLRERRADFQADSRAFSTRNQPDHE